MHYTNIDGQLAVQAFDGVCVSHEQGHAPHIIQIRKALEGVRTSASVNPQIRSGEVSVTIEGKLRTIFNHHANVVYEIHLLHPNSTVEFSENYNLLIIRSGEGEGFAFSCSDSPLSNCREL